MAHRYHGTLETVALPKAYKHYLSDVNTDVMTATCSNCGAVPIYSDGKNRFGNPAYICSVKKKEKDATARKGFTYSFGDGQIISAEDAHAARIRFYEDQSGCCAICNRHESVAGTLHLDHCHDSGKLRGLLGSGCNLGLGLFRDSIGALIAATEYLSR
jgi:hypothetical protein